MYHTTKRPGWDRGLRVFPAFLGLDPFGALLQWVPPPPSARLCSWQAFRISNIKRIVCVFFVVVCFCSSVHKQEVSRGSVVEEQDCEQRESLLPPSLSRPGRRVPQGMGAILRGGRRAADRTARAVGLNKVPVLKQCVWGQVHTGIWDSYEVRLLALYCRGSGFVCFAAAVVSPLCYHLSSPPLFLSFPTKNKATIAAVI